MCKQYKIYLFVTLYRVLMFENTFLNSNFWAPNTHKSLLTSNLRHSFHFFETNLGRRETKKGSEESQNSFNKVALPFDQRDKVEEAEIFVVIQKATKVKNLNFEKSS